MEELENEIAVKQEKGRVLGHKKLTINALYEKTIELANNISEFNDMKYEKATLHMKQIYEELNQLKKETNKEEHLNQLENASKLAKKLFKRMHEAMNDRSKLSSQYKKEFVKNLPDNIKQDRKRVFKELGCDENYDSPPYI